MTHPSDFQRGKRTGRASACRDLNLAAVRAFYAALKRIAKLWGVRP